MSEDRKIEVGTVLALRHEKLSPTTWLVLSITEKSITFLRNASDETSVFVLNYECKNDREWLKIDRWEGYIEL